MRDPKRIDEILNAVKTVWEQYPDWRFGQLVVNVLGVDPFYIEDEIILAAFQANIKGRKEKDV